MIVGVRSFVLNSEVTFYTWNLLSHLSNATKTISNCADLHSFHHQKHSRKQKKQQPPRDNQSTFVPFLVILHGLVSWREVSEPWFTNEMSLI